MLLQTPTKHWAAGYYRVGQSWIALLKAPRFGMIHLSHPIWWKPLALLPGAIIATFRIMRQR